MLARCLAVGTGVGLLLGLLAGPGTDTGTGVVLVLLGALLGCGLGGLTAVFLDYAEIELPERRPARAARPVGEPVVVEDDPGPIVPAGWYPDPRGGAEPRYWDGERWS